MALSIKNPEVDRLARELANLTGESMTEAILQALKERLRREQGKAYPIPLHEDLRAIRERCSALPVLDDREPDEILGYDDDGVPS